MDLVLRIFKAVANERRIKLIRLLYEKGRLALGEISEAIDIPEATACRNLKILEKVGMVKSDIRGAIAEYWLNQDTKLVINQRVIEIILRK